MKYHVVLILFFVSTALFYGCKKNNEKREYTIKGRVVQSCFDSTPASSLNLILQYSGSGVSGAKTFVAGSATTDKDGYFTLTYENIEQTITGMYLTRDVSFGQSPILWDIPVNTDLQIENIYRNIIINRIYKIKVGSKITSIYDTIMYNAGSITKFVIGPFFDNQIVDSLLLNSLQVYGTETESSTFTWKLGASNPWIRDDHELHLCKEYSYAIIDLSLVK
jgi:hypothetical protein